MLQLQFEIMLSTAQCKIKVHFGRHKEGGPTAMVTLHNLRHVKEQCFQVTFSGFKHIT